MGFKSDQVQCNVCIIHSLCYKSSFIYRIKLVNIYISQMIPKATNSFSHQCGSECNIIPEDSVLYESMDRQKEESFCSFPIQLILDIKNVIRLQKLGKYKTYVFPKSHLLRSSLGRRVKEKLSEAGNKISEELGLFRRVLLPFLPSLLLFSSSIPASLCAQIGVKFQKLYNPELINTIHFCKNVMYLKRSFHVIRL